MVLSKKKTSIESIGSLLPILMVVLIGLAGCNKQETSENQSSTSTAQAANNAAAAPVDESDPVAAVPLDLSYIPSTAMAALVLSPERILSSKEFELYPIEVLEAVSKRAMGVNVKDVTQAIGLMQLSQEAPVPLAGAIIRLSRAHQLGELFPMLKAEGLVKQREVDGRQILYVNENPPISLTMPDDKTVLVGIGDFLSRMLAAKNADSPLIKLLKQSDANHELIAVVSADMLPDPIKEIAMNPEAVPLAIAGYVSALKHLSAVEVTVDTSNRWAGELVIHAHDDAEAKKLEETILQGLEFGKQMFLAQAAQIDSGDEVIDAAMQKYMIRIADYLAEAFRPTRDASRLTMDSNATMGIATTGVMVALLLPAVQSARHSARRMSSSNNLKQIGLALHNYHETYKQFPVGESPAIKYQDGKQLLSWRVHILPFIEQEPLYRQFKLDEPWNSAHNIRLLDQIPPVYLSPHHPASNNTVYVAPMGPNTILGSGKRIRFRDITDGTSQTIAVIEAGLDQAVPWTKPDDLRIDPDDPVGSVGLVEGTFQALFSDGSVQSISTGISADILNWMIQVNDGHPINRNDGN